MYFWELSVIELYFSLCHCSLVFCCSTPLLVMSPLADLTVLTRVSTQCDINSHLKTASVNAPPTSLLILLHKLYYCSPSLSSLLLPVVYSLDWSAHNLIWSPPCWCRLVPLVCGLDHNGGRTGISLCILLLWTLPYLTTSPEETVSTEN